MKFNMSTDNLKREHDSIDVEKHTKTPRRRSEDVRLANFDWTKEEVGETKEDNGKRPRFLYKGPNGEQETSMRKAMAAIRLTASTKGALANVEQAV